MENQPPAPETLTVSTPRFACDGTGPGLPAGLGHPRVFLTIGQHGTVDCPYCDRHFVLAAGADSAH